jgi:hypothetical protein
VKFFDGKILQSLSENLVHVPGTSNGRAFVAILSRHATAELERCVNGDSARGPNTGETRQRSDRL